MTEDSFQQAQKIMQQAVRYRRTIATQKAEVKKWTALEDYHRIEKRETRRESAQRLLDKAIQRLKEAREKFAALTFPDSNLSLQKSSPCLHGFTSANNCPEDRRCILCTPVE